MGQGSKAFITGVPDPDETILRIDNHTGILQHHPDELTVTARAGTRLRDLRSALATHRQRLFFDPPEFLSMGTLGGAVSCGMSGPDRPWHGAPRDGILGIHMLDVEGRNLRFGGQVIKNVAGYDISRFMTGAWGTLGIILDLSLRLLPLPETTATLVFELDQDAALIMMTTVQGQFWPLSGAAWEDGVLRIRLEGCGSAVNEAIARLGGDEKTRTQHYWNRLRDMQLPFFRALEEQEEHLVRIDVLPATPAYTGPGRMLLDWGGARRWWRGTDSSKPHRWATHHGGWCLPWRSPYSHKQSSKEACIPLSRDGPEAALESRLRRVFDPHARWRPQCL